MVSFGITPTRPETGYGYIQCSSAAAQGEARTIQRCVEKPQRETAQGDIADVNFLWNAGIFMLRASVWLATMRICCPDTLAAYENAWRSGKNDGEFARVDGAAFNLCPSDSIDYAVMERITQQPVVPQFPQALVLPLSVGWSDVGAWDALWDVLAKDAHGNVARGDVILEDGHNTLAFSQGRLLACVGVDNIVVVETPDAILVAHKDRTQDVKKIVTHLQREGRAEEQNHRKLYRHWGWYDSVDMGARF